MTIWSWLLQHLISVSLLAALVWLLCLGLKNRPAWRHALWLVVLIKLVTPPLIVWPWSVNQVVDSILPETQTVFQEEPVPEPVFRESDPEIISPEPASMIAESGFADNDTPVLEGFTTSLHGNSAPEPIEQDLPPVTESFPVLPELPVVIQRETPDEILTETEHPLTTSEPAVAAPVITPETVESGLNALLGLWAVGSIVFLIVQLRRLLRQRAICLRGEAPSRELVDTIARVSRDLQMEPVRATVVQEIGSPFLWCLGKPKLAWPHAMTDEKTLRQSKGIIAHELAHIRRRDHWVTWLELAAGVIWWWNPLFWYVRRRLREASEMACDAVALSLYDERKTYAELFLKLSTYLQSGDAAPVLGVSTGHSSAIERRIAMIMSDRVSGKMPGWGILAVICFAVLVLPSLSVGEDHPATDRPTTTEGSERAAAPRNDTSQKLPILGDIPVVGRLFDAVDYDQDGQPDLVIVNGEKEGNAVANSESSDSGVTEAEQPSRNLTVSERLQGTWVLTDRQPTKHVDFMMINIDTENRRFIGCWKHGEASGFSENRFTIDTTQIPYHLTVDTGHGIPMLMIFDLNSKRLRIAFFDRDEIAVKVRPGSFDDRREGTGPLVVETFERPEPGGASTQVPEASSEGRSPIADSPARDVLEEPFELPSQPQLVQPSRPSSGIGGGALNPARSISSASSPSEIPAGFRVYTVRVDGSPPHLDSIHPGDLVDVYVTYLERDSEGSVKPTTAHVLSKIRVLAIGKDAAHDRSTNVSLLVEPKQAATISSLAASRKGDITVGAHGQPILKPGSTPPASNTNPLAAHMQTMQAARVGQPQVQIPTKGPLGVDFLGSQTLPEINVSPDEEIQKLQRRWLEMNVELAKAALDVESKNYEFRVRMSQKGYSSSADLEQARAQMRQKELQVERAEILLKLFELHAKRIKESVRPFQPEP